ncbi:hypothetical protein [Methylorubrum thiocyanatum]|uniref:Uncharacterized protein n=1 Tax=Methylorubrum thiocyanatum TaxID=47958 RepID=A0AA40S7R2_9HYPH|nr:hypothetical protein [Methylorubrum thiocyanatum]MBA8916003.1 hypothetical protein [Methylorubrum thiocyanatum]GJE80912.1 hypothetical protein CJNNKLLH_2253 [Methylorubrum thiocyanatum]
MNNQDNPAMASLARRLIVAELASKGAKDPETIEMLVTARLRITESGDLVALNRGGSVMPGDALANAVEDIRKTNPSLFGDTAKPEGDAGNPFADGPSKNVTAQMLLWRSDPERAEHLAAEAGIKLSRNR